MSDVAAVAGAVSGAVEALVVQPLDMVKTRFQLNPGQNPSIISEFRQLIKEGGFPRLYRGVLPEMAGNMPTRTAMFTGKTIGSDVLVKITGSKSVFTEFGAGAIAGVPEGLVTNPFQVVKVRLQSRAHNAAYKNTFDCFATIFRMEGPLAFLIGWKATVKRNSLWNAVYFSSMMVIQREVGPPSPGISGTIQSLASGFVGGVTATCCNAPLDVAKSRIQGNVGSGTTSTFGILANILQQEGAAALYKGFAPKALRMGCGGAVGITTFEFVSKILQRS
eukprot:TRINITY_DN42795_c0_g1_i1.p1 TRINITY_DN42795_c0_g1~~TRINITY_DN42795_c0_g1_i1.p1  ORF type:complete len:277 (+),score=38.08 TRINITY_DN42795_c0_g1_i1:317-1147(+)